MNLKILNTRDVKKIHEQLNKQFGYKKKLDYAFLKSARGRIYLVTRDIAEINFEELNIDTVGFYFATEDDSGELRLTIEGSQLVGPNAKHNVLELSDGLFKLWFAGHDIETKEELKGYVIIKNNNDYYSCGRIVNGTLRNFVPKTRRIINRA